MDVIDICISLAPVPALNPAFSIFRCLCSAIQRLGFQWNEQQLRALVTAVAELLLALDGDVQTDHLAESQVSPEVDTLQMYVIESRRRALLIYFSRLIKEINSFVQSQESRAFLKLLFTKDERIVAIDTYQRRLCSYVHAFQVSLKTGLLYCPYPSKLSAVIDIQDWQKKNDKGRDIDHQLLDDYLTELEANQAKLREVLGIFNIIHTWNVPK
jgi:hypothetical protein